MEAIILAGGLGTRLQSVVADVPKCMALVAGKPFLQYLLETLETAGFEHIILSLGYKHEVVETWLTTYQTSLQITSVVENVPLGTGGAVRKALLHATQKAVFVFNGDSFLTLDYQELMKFHLEKKVLATLALKQMHAFCRYGAVETGADAKIIRFGEKQYCESGFINGGVYVLNRSVLNVLDKLGNKFSLEKDFFEPEVGTGKLAGFYVNGYFIDIGIPDDYLRAQTDFANGKHHSV
jgi:D-glycero-alpha-D-manno-heptose 1-phosphate guanylyltransferase